MWNRSMASCGAALALALGTVNAAAAAPPSQEFVGKVGIAGLYEVRAAEIAEEKSPANEVREFAKMMLADHRKANDELRSLAKKRSWTMPAALDPKHRELVDRLAMLEGAAFDREYAQQQVQAHEQAVALFKEQADQGTDPELKAWALQKLPVLRGHLEHAENLQAEKPPAAGGVQPEDGPGPGERM